VEFRPAALHVIDQNENAIAELVRDLRSGPTDFDIPELRALTIDFGSPIMQRALRHERYDLA
jgi:hypothetical protein